MNTSRLLSALAVPVLMGVLALPAEAGEFLELGVLPGQTNAYGSSISGDGTVVTGYSYGNSGTYRAFRWTSAGGMQDLGALPGDVISLGNSVSGDGAVVVGSSRTSNTSSGVQHAFLWTSGGGMQDLGTLSGFVENYASGTNGDGSVVVGVSTTSSGAHHAFRWTSGGGMQDLGTLGGSGDSHAVGSSLDGTVVAGTSITSSGVKHAFRWTSGGMQDLGTLLGLPESYASGISSDGMVVVGSSDNNNIGIHHAFRWTSIGGMQDLGTLPYCEFSLPYATSSDGGVVVGYSGGNGLGTHAFVWDGVHGMRALAGVLAAQDIQMLADWRLGVATSVTQVGTTVYVVCDGSGVLGGGTKAFLASYDINYAGPTHVAYVGGTISNTNDGFTAQTPLMAVTENVFLGDSNAINVGVGHVWLATDTTLASLTQGTSAFHAATINMYGKTLTLGNGPAAIGTVSIGAGNGALTFGLSTDDGVLTAGLGGASTLVLDNQSAANMLTVDAVIANGASDSVALIKTGVGAVILSGTNTNTYTGTTTISAGTLQIGNGGTTGTLGAGNVVNHASLVFNRSDTLTVSNVLSGRGSVNQSGSGTLVLTGANNYNGATILNDGILQVGDGGITGNLGAGNVVTHAILAFNRRDAVFVFNAISGDGSANQFGSGSLIFMNNNTYTGTTTISRGILQVGNGGTSGMLGAGTVNNLGTLIFKRSDTVVVSNVIAGSGVVRQSGKGTVILTGENTYFGNTQVKAGGTLQIGNGGTAGSLDTGSFAVDGILVFNKSDVLTVSGLIHGKGAVVQSGTGTTILTSNHANSYNGTTTIHAGTLCIGNGGTGGTLGSGAVMDNGALVFNRSNTVLVGNTITGSGTLSQIGAGTTILAGNNTYAGTTTISAGCLQVGRGGESGYSGALGSGAVINNALLAFKRSDRITVANDIFGTGGVQNTGTGVTLLSGINTYTGPTQVLSGVLKAGRANQAFGVNSAMIVNGTLNLAGFDQTIGALWGNGTVVGGGLGAATLTLGADNGSGLLSGNIQNGGSTIMSVIKVGSGTQTFAGTATRYTGTTLISAGRLNVIRSVTGGGTLTNNATLGMANGSAHTGAVINNAGSFMHAAGSVTTGDLSFANGSTLILANGDTLITAGAVTVTAGAQIATTSATGFTPGTQKLVIDGTSASGVFTVNTALSASAAVGYHWVSTTVGSDIFLGTQLNAPLLAAGTTQQTATLSAIGHAGAAIAVDPDIQANIAYLAGLSGSALKDALNRQSGHDRAAQGVTLGQHAMARGQAMQQLAANLDADTHGSAQASAADAALRASALDGLQSGKVEEGGDLSFFVQATRGSERRNTQASGALGSTANGSLFSVGVCDEIADNLNVGVAFTFDMTDIKSGGGLGKSENRTYGLDLFASHTLDAAKRWYVAGDIGMGILRADNTRYGVGAGGLTATSNTQGVETHLSGEIGCKVDAWANAVLTPHAGLSYVYHTIDASQESLPGAPGMALSYAAKHEQLLQSVVGADLAQSFDIGGGNILTPSLGVSWVHQLDSADNRLVTSFTGSPTAGFTTRLADMAADAVELSASVSVKLGSRLSASVNAKTTQSLDADAKGHQESVGAGLKYDF